MYESNNLVWISAIVFTGKVFIVTTDLRCAAGRHLFLWVAVLNCAYRNTKHSLKQMTFAVFEQYNNWFNIFFLSLKRKTPSCVTPVSLKTPRLSERTFSNHDDDDDVIILEESSTPKPSADSDVPVVKTECINVDQEEKQIENSDVGEPCSATASDSKSEQLTSATQTDVPNLVVKKEEMEDETEIPIPSAEVEIKQHNVNNLSETSADLGNELRNQLQLVNKEKEMYQNKCEVLTKQVETLEQRILEMNNKYVKKEMCHQSTETISSFAEENIHERSLAEVSVLYEQALEEIAKLKEQCSTLQNLKTECSKCADGESKSEVDEIAVQLDDVFRQLDKCSIERDSYKNEVCLLKRWYASKWQLKT